MPFFANNAILQYLWYKTIYIWIKLFSGQIPELSCNITVHLVLGNVQCIFSSFVPRRQEINFLIVKY